MNDWQLARQFKYLAMDRIWPGGEKVLGDCRVTPMTSEDAFGLLTFPYFLINLEDASADPANPGLFEQVLSGILGVSVAGDQFGETALLGGVRSNGILGSGGRGLLEVQEEVFEALALLTGADGVNATCTYKSGVAAAIVEDIGYVTQRAFRFECLATLARYYHAPQNLVKSTDDLTWTLPPERFDRFKVHLRKNLTTTPPTSATDGTEVVLASNLATSVTDAVVGTVSYAIFCEYDEVADFGKTLNGAPPGQERYSQASTSIPGTTVVVP